MSEERRQTRLLPFRRRANEEGRAADAGPEGFDEDAELRQLLRAWEAPDESAAARARLLASFRERAARQPLWKRLLTSSVRVPLPVAACAALAFALSAYALVARGTLLKTAETTNTPAPVVKVVEVPVVQERVVERVVYVEKKERTAAWPATRQLASAARSHSAPRPASDASYVTPVDMAVFEPSREINFRIVKRGKTDDE
ncbi:MAG TPA: hypothetical protein VGX48_13165 [Pyrinomonadaceae bacterium]|jgi:hypothetical protein|nr:hypothetical protein [Pyrinomonadaceae bacterium]